MNIHQNVTANLDSSYRVIYPQWNLMRMTCRMFSIWATITNLSCYEWKKENFFNGHFEIYDKIAEINSTFNIITERFPIIGPRIHYFIKPNLHITSSLSRRTTSRKSKNRNSPVFVACCMTEFSLKCPMSLSSFSAKIPLLHIQIRTRRRNIYISPNTPSFSSLFDRKLLSILTNYRFSKTQTIVCATMEDHNNSAVESFVSDKYFKELEVAVKAVQMACLLCQRIQQTLLSKANDHVQSKDDNSPVTIAGNSFTLFWFYFSLSVVDFKNVPGFEFDYILWI